MCELWRIDVETKLLKVDEVASVLNVTKSFVYQLIRAAKLPAVHFGKAVRIHPDDLDQFINSSRMEKSQLCQNLLLGSGN